MWIKIEKKIFLDAHKSNEKIYTFAHFMLAIIKIA